MTHAPQEVFNLLPNLDVDAIIRAFTLQVQHRVFFRAKFTKLCCSTLVPAFI